MDYDSDATIPLPTPAAYLRYANQCLRFTDSKRKYGANEITYSEAHDDDPKIRKPNIKRAKTILNWEPTTNIFKGLDITYEYFKEIVK